MDVMLKGRKTFTQSYNPKCIIISEKRPNNQVVYRCYPSIDSMRPSDGAAYRTAMTRKIRSTSCSNIKRENNTEDFKTCASLLDMSSDERVEFVVATMNSCDESSMTAEQYAMVKASLKEFMIQNALDCQNS